MIRAKASVYVLGAGGHAKCIVRTLQELGYQVLGIFDDNKGKWGTNIYGVPITGPLCQVKDRPAQPAILAIGDNASRRALAQSLDLEWLTVVHPSAHVDRSVKLGLGTVVSAGAVIQPDAIVGDHVIVNTSASIDHDCAIGAYSHIGPGVHLAGSVILEEGVFLGTGSVVIPGRRVGAWTTVGAGGVVTKDLPHLSIAVGIPARIQPSQRTSGAASTEVRTAAPQNGGSANRRIYLSPPHMSGQERELLLDAFDSNWIAPIGPHVDAFEREFAEKLGVEYAVAVSSGTAAIHLALLLKGIGPGDEVATSSLTFAASANAIRYTGATPVFIDSDRHTWNLDPELLAAELEAQIKCGQPIKAVLAVDICGQCADYDAILKTCELYETPLIEDAAEALGAVYRGRPAGTFGDIGCFSFNGNKVITTSGGGMLVTRHKELADRARFLATHARDPASHYEHSELGYNYRMSNLLAAVGRGQLRVLEDRVDRRRANFRAYERALGNIEGIEFMPEIAGGRSSRWLTCILVHPDKFGATREDIRQALERENIESRPLWKPMHLQPLYAGCRFRGGAVSEALFREGLCLPSGSDLTEDDLARIVRVIQLLQRQLASYAQRA